MLWCSCCLAVVFPSPPKRSPAARLFFERTPSLTVIWRVHGCTESWGGFPSCLRAHPLRFFLFVCLFLFLLCSASGTTLFILRLMDAGIVFPVVKLRKQQIRGLLTTGHTARTCPGRVCLFPKPMLCPAAAASEYFPGIREWTGVRQSASGFALGRLSLKGTLVFS